LLHRSAGLEPVAEPIAARIVADACAGLGAAHEVVGPDGVALGVVHRDVSPPNILLSLHGQVKVSDFGIAKARLQIHSKTRTGEIKGKFAYIAPEQIGGKGIDHRADIFALGCVLYVATLGLRPFGSGPKAMSKILAGEYKKPSELTETYPPELESVIVRALQRSPADRYQSAEAMRMDLERWLMTLDTPVGTKDLAALVNTRLEPKKRKVVETLMRSNQFLPDAMVYQLVRGEVEQTPTATSSVMFGPLSNPAIELPERQLERRTSGKPMVRFTALGRPLSADAVDERASVGATKVATPGNVTDPTELTEAPTSADLDGRSHPSSASPAEAANAGPTYRPPRLKPLSTVAGGRRPVSLLGGMASRRFWVVAFVASAIAAGWASCQFIPQ
jgi:serine/threonine-protein kinase